MWTDQVRTVVSWLADKRPASLVLFYLSQPGDKIRAFGPESPEADLAVSKVSYGTSPGLLYYFETMLRIRIRALHMYIPEQIKIIGSGSDFALTEMD